jgi:hypothetical protein
MTASSEQRVSVDGTPHTITVIHTSKTVWVAVGDYMCADGTSRQLEGKGSSASSAAKDWIRAARYWAVLIKRI